ncbi:MAG: cyclase family protein [Bernardetiaceae bacterium]|nr:cyclase family protein [Bernardetiaceae bacterium]
MNFYIEFEDKKYSGNFQSPLDISLPLRKGEQNPNCYYAEPPQFETIRFGESFIGSVAEGGSCNYQKITLTPHGNGTHTECYGHISADGFEVQKALQNFMFVAYLLSLEPQTTSTGDSCIRLTQFEKALEQAHLKRCPEAIIIRTLPNTDDKKIRVYNDTNPPYLEAEIAHFLKMQGVKHLLIDLPSLDRESDGGKLAAHHAFFDYPQNPRKEATVTELIFVPNTVPDGLYLLNLQIISLCTDASPSKPVLYELQKV